jgi:hypothetical protein
MKTKKLPWSPGTTVLIYNINLNNKEKAKTMVNKFKRNRFLIFITLAVLTILTIVIGNLPIIAYTLG